LGNKADDLSHRMNTSVRPPGADDPRFPAGNFRQHSLYFALYGSPFSLQLETKVISAVILDDGHNKPPGIPPALDFGPHQPFYSTNSKTTSGAPSPCRRPSL